MGRWSPSDGRRLARGYWHRYLYKPYYLHSPTRLARRVVGALPHAETLLPWGLPIAFQPGSIVGTQLARAGVHDLVLTEALHRLTDPGDLCVDVGANVGYTTSLLAIRSGPRGRVVSYEPAPDVHALLERNVGSWRGAAIAAIELRRSAVSSRAGRLALNTPTAHGGDPGGRTLEPVAGALEQVGVQTATLDDGGLDGIGLLKIDVEGHELSVLDGARRLLDERGVRDIVFEEHERPPTPVTQRLEQAGYALMRIEQAMGGPRLVVDIERPFEVLWDAPNYVATIDPERAWQRFAARGWRCLRRPR